MVVFGEQELADTTASACQEDQDDDILDDPAPVDATDRLGLCKMGLYGKRHMHRLHPPLGEHTTSVEHPFFGQVRADTGDSKPMSVTEVFRKCSWEEEGQIVLEEMDAVYVVALGVPIALSWFIP